MVKECILLGHRISRKGIEVDKAKIETIETYILLSSTRKRVSPG